MKMVMFQFTYKHDMEKEVNAWLVERDVEIFKILQSESENFITISIFYKQAE